MDKGNIMSWHYLVAILIFPNLMSTLPYSKLVPIAIEGLNNLRREKAIGRAL